jgi:hypothetical protein
MRRCVQFVLHFSLLALLVFGTSPISLAKSHSSSHSSYRSHSYRSHSSYGSHSSYRGTRSSRTYTGAGRDSHGRIKRSTAAKDEFKREHPARPMDTLQDAVLAM